MALRMGFATHRGDNDVLVGYARVSTPGQDFSLQKDALEQAGCERLFTDVASGAKASRPGLAEALDYMRGGDTLVVWRLDRLGRSLSNLIEVVRNLDDDGVGFRSLREQVDTTTTGGKLVFHVFGALAEFERELIRERTSAGLRAARARGRVGGRRKRMTPEQVQQASLLLANRSCDVAEVCRTFGVHRATLYRNVKNYQRQGLREASSETMGS